MSPDALFTEPELLQHPQIPKPLHGCSPRVVLGKEWWDEMRKQAYAENNFCCFACGVPRDEAKYKKWLEGHEFYEYDYMNCRLTLKRIVALCHSCHNYIHSGRLNALRSQKLITRAMYADIMRHGDTVLNDAGLLKAAFPRGDSGAWTDWRMVINGKEYGPTTPSFEAWKRGEWKNWSPNE